MKSFLNHFQRPTGGGGPFSSIEGKMKNQFICGDSLELMWQIPPQSVGLIFGSPPYEDARFYGELGFRLKGQEWVNWMVEIYKAALHCCKGLVAFVVQGRTRQYRWSATPALLMADLHRAGINLRNPPLYFRSGIPGSGGPDWLRSDYEWVVCASHPGKLPWSNNVAMGKPPKCKPGGSPTHRLQNGKRIRIASSKGKAIKRGTNRGLNPQSIHYKVGTETIEEQPYIPPKKANPGNLIGKDLPHQGMRYPDGTRRKHGYTLNKIEVANPGNIIRCSGGHLGSKLAHENEAPFPEYLAEFMIRSFCPPNGWVLDPFSGSGTTCAVAERLGRSWTGIDIRQSQIELGQRRIEEVKNGQR